MTIFKEAPKRFINRVAIIVETAARIVDANSGVIVAKAEDFESGDPTQVDKLEEQITESRKKRDEEVTKITTEAKKELKTGNYSEFRHNLSK